MFGVDPTKHDFHVDYRLDNDATSRNRLAVDDGDTRCTSSGWCMSDIILLAMSRIRYSYLHIESKNIVNSKSAML